MLKQRRTNQSGISIIELVPILLIFALIVNYSLGFFGIIHSGILNSIAARNYAFETFRNRSQLTYLRDVPDSIIEEFKDNGSNRYTKFGYRYHGIVSESSASIASQQQRFVATKRPIKFTDLADGPTGTATADDHQTLVRSIADSGKVSETFSGKAAGDGQSGVSPVWIQTMYGMCLNSECKKE